MTVSKSSTLFVQKLGVVVGFTCLALLVGGLYGIINDEFTYTLSQEYYTKFKFYQFRLAFDGNEAILPHPRLAVAQVGFMATWWMGMLIGLILSLVGLSLPNAKTMFVTLAKTLVLVLSITFILALAGLCYGWWHLSQTGVTWWLPHNLINTKAFIAVGSMHNFSYLGGIAGLLCGIAYLLYTKRRKF